MTLDYKLRKATPKDLNNLLELEDTCFTQDKMSRQSYRSLLKKSSAEIIVAESNDTIIASTTIFYRKNSTIARLYSLAVHPDYRQHGIANAIQKQIESNAQTRKCTRILLEVRPDNAAAIQFYKKQGYEPIGTYTQFYEDGSDALRMVKCIHLPNTRY